MFSKMVVLAASPKMTARTHKEKPTSRMDVLFCFPLWLVGGCLPAHETVRGEPVVIHL